MQQRLICAMSCFDFVVSTVWFLNIYFIPPSFEAKGLPIALGNDINCSVQGFIIQLYTATFMYNVSLSTYYLLMINYNWGRTKISEIEKYFHLLPISFGLITAIIAVSLGKIGMADWDCWIEPKYGGLQWGFFFGPLVVSLSITLFNLLQVYLAIKKAESDSNAWRMSNSGNQTKQVARQNQFYVISFAISWVPPTIARFIQLFGVTLPDWFVVACGTVIPSQGFFNALVYFRLRYCNCGIEHANKPWWWLVCRIISLTIFPCCLKDDHNVHDGRDLEHDSDTNNAERTIDYRPLDSFRQQNEHNNDLCRGGAYG